MNRSQNNLNRLYHFLPFRISLLRHFKTIITVTFVLILQFASSQLAQAQNNTGSVEGKVISSDSINAESISVSVKGTNKGTSTDKNGNFMISNLSPGNYTLIVNILGYETLEIPAEIKAGETTTLNNIALKEDVKTLEQIIVTGNAPKFAQKESDYVARMPLKNLENPQVYTVVGKELMQEQIATDYSTAFRNAPGVTPSANPAGSLDISMRGFTTSTSVRNGMASQAWTMVDPVNIERTEIIKGPSGTLFSSSTISFGGLVNRVTKKPFETFGGEVSYSSGSYDLNRLTVDLNTPLNKDKTLLFRVNAATHSENSFQNYGHTRSSIIAPSFTYKVSNKLILFLDAELYKTTRTQQPYYFISPSDVTFRNFKDIPLNYTSSLGGEDIDAQQSTSNYFVQALYKISKNLTSTTNFTSSSNRIDYSYQFYPTWLNDTMVSREVDLYGPRSFTTIDFQQNFNHDITIGKFRNRLLAGVDVNYYSGKQKVAWATYDTVNIAHPFAAITKTQSDKLMGTLGNNYTAQQLNYSAYASDVLSFNERIMAMFSLRADAFRNYNSMYNGVNSNDSYKQNTLSPKLGLVYQVVKDRVSLFTNYMNGFANVAPVMQPNGAISVFKAQQANQWEIGIKTDAWQHRLTTTVSYYDIEVRNNLRVDPVSFQTVQDGTLRSKGVEVEFIANLIKGFNIVAGYAHNENVYVKAEEGIQGKINPGAPRETFNLWLSYKLTSTPLKGLGVGAGANYVSSAFWDSANEFTLPAYTLVNATLFYDQPRWRIGIKANNITDQHYWSFNGTPQQLRQFVGNFTFKF